MYEGKFVRLRALAVDDAERNAKWLSDLETARLVRGGGAMPLSIAEEQRWIEQNSGAHKGDACHFAIDTLDGRHIGVCSYNSVNWRNRTCMVGWFIGDKDMRGRGYGSDMIKLLLSICFDELDMHKVSLAVFSYNEAAVRLYERLGFAREAVYREQVFARGRRWDEYGYSMLKREYIERYGQI